MIRAHLTTAAPPTWAHLGQTLPALRVHGGTAQVKPPSGPGKLRYRPQLGVGAVLRGQLDNLRGEPATQRNRRALHPGPGSPSGEDQLDLVRPAGRRPVTRGALWGL